MSQEGAPRANRYNIDVFNTTGEQVPPFGVMQIVSASTFGSNTVYNITKPTGAANAKYLVNSPVPILAGIPGSATDQYPTDAAYAGATPIANAEWGPVVNSWLLSINGKGFQILGGAASGVVRVAAKAGTAAGDDFPLVKMVNTSGLFKPFGTIFGYGAPVDPPPGTLYRIPTFLSAPPQAGKPFVVMLQDVANSDVGDAGPIGVVACQINYTDAAHTHAEAITNDYTKLASATSGPALIIWRERAGVAGGGSLGVQWARVRLDPVAMTSDPRGVIESILTAASGTRSGPSLTPGFGNVRLYIMPQSGPIGTPWAKGTLVQCETWMHDQSAVGKPAIFRESRKADDGSQIYLAIAQGCKEVPS